jgi:threonine dehydrogenase-like Zn-dependent dehydrogenase
MLKITLDEPGKFSARTDAPELTLAPGEVLVRVHRIGVCGTDRHAFSGKQPFFRYPRVLGHELGVEVIDLGTESPGLRTGDCCSVEPPINCGRCIACRRGKPNCCTEVRVMGVHVDGGMCSHLAVSAHKLHRSASLDYEQLALVETLGIGAHAVERSEAKPDDFILVISAGPIGLSVIQFALVTGTALAVMDVSESRLAFRRDRMGARHTVLASPDASEQLRAIGGDRPTIVIDATGNPQSMAKTFDLAAHDGRIVFVGLFQGGPVFQRSQLSSPGTHGVREPQRAPRHVSRHHRPTGNRACRYPSSDNPPIRPRRHAHYLFPRNRQQSRCVEGDDKPDVLNSDLGSPGGRTKI